MDRAADTMSRAARVTLAALALCAGALAAIARDPQPAPAPDEITAIELGEWIRARRAGVHVLDARSAEAMARDRVPGAVSAAGFDAAVLARGDILVVYADRRTDRMVLDALRPRVGHARLLRLHGGFAAWNHEVLFPRIRADASERERQRFAPRAQLSRYFGGTPRVLDPGTAPTQPRSRRGC
jgi:hypothetical protein